MKFKECWDQYRFYTGKTSELSRQVAFAGIALIWVFKIESDSGARVPEALVLPGALLALALACDILQYASGSLAWFFFNRSKERAGVSLDEDVLSPPWMHWPAQFFFVAKVVIVAAAYFLIFAYLIQEAVHMPSQ